MHHWSAFLNIGSHLEEATEFGGYILVFVFAMIPGIEPFIVIPVAIGLGLDPILTGFAAFAGSVAVVVAIVLVQKRLITWWRRRTGTDVSVSSKRYNRARRISRRYGLVGLALVGPIIAGIHLTALFAAVMGSDSRVTIGWLSLGLCIWTIGLVAGTVAGLSLLELP
ncbi:putative membrane protein (plasmid) [Halalkaliarchaeum sp. AArc-CO]|uniref:small multi-drug export protein n=1 Tax=Halalkaliarchaeum sp. AArc-CO TaxID=2866381 RepID=UPI00217E1D01|nr:small multi-drug export protein [Halalkaliarchaeum sp. AArc-CO]UWG49324.1 putative membrane protein [Halalkaliarchaeum sp. AArc-CO]